MLKHALIAAICATSGAAIAAPGEPWTYELVMIVGTPEAGQSTASLAAQGTKGQALQIDGKKCAAIAKLMLAAGAMGVTCAPFGTGADIHANN